MENKLDDDVLRILRMAYDGLSDAGSKFAFYAEQHIKKFELSAMEKAALNVNMAANCLSKRLAISDFVLKRGGSL